MSSYAIFFLAFPMLFSLTKSNGYDDYTPPSPPPSPSPPPPLANRCHPSSTCDSKNGEINVSYPFWRREYSNGSRIVCGYPEFGIDCSNSDYGYPILRLEDDTFLVKKINYKEKTIVLADADVSPKCPRPIHNFTLNQKPPLLYNRIDLHFTFYFNCTNNIFGDAHDVFPLECLSYYDSYQGNNFSSYLYVGLPNYYVPDWSRFCDDVVETTVMKTEEIAKKNFGLAMSNGFVLDWRAVEECDRCESTGGVCAQDMTRSGEIVCFCATTKGSCPSNKESKGQLRTPVKLGLVGTFSLLGLALLSTLILCYLRRRPFGEKGDEITQNIEAFIRTNGLHAPKLYTYSEIKKMTNSFKDKVGEGGFGSVYKGKLPDGSPVAVKLLTNTKGNGEDFINEVASISRTSHVNVVSLLGFSYQKKRALVYEFMLNGSLDKFICNKGSQDISCRLEWITLHRIAIGVARGLEYLHRGCNTRIMHFDIKPNNILLDVDFTPKISDFGLAKFCKKKGSIQSLSAFGARGTIGYIAPEVFFRSFGGVSHKSDVYSYGMTVIDMVGVREKVVNTGDQATSESYFPDWIYDRLEQGVDFRLQGIMNEDDKEMAMKLILVGLWCVQTNPSDRPSIRRVVEMLDGSIDSLQIPPKPILCAPTELLRQSSSSSIATEI